MPSYHASAAHIAPSFTHPFAGTSSGFHIIEEKWRELQAREERRDILLSSMNQQLKDNMDFMRESQRQTDSSLCSIMESKQALLSNQQRQQENFQRHLTLMEATQGSVLGNLRQLWESDALLSVRFDRLEVSREERRRSKSRRPRHSEPGGEGTSGQQ